MSTIERTPQAKTRSNIPLLVAAFSASMTTGGTTYAFGLYGADLKRSLHLSAGQLDTISTAFFFAGLLSWIPGICTDRFGTRCSLTSGGFLAAAALLLYWGVARQFLHVPRSWLVTTLSVLGVVIFLACALITGSVFKIIVANCGAGTKGSAVGVAKGYVGLGAGAYACLFESIRVRGESNLDFLPMAAFFMITVASLPALVLLPTRQQVESDIFQDDATPRHFHTLYGSLIAMAALVIGNSLSVLLRDSSAVVIAEDGTALPASHSSGRQFGMAFLLVLVWIGPIVSLLYLPRRSHQSVDLSLDDIGYHDEVLEQPERDESEVLDVIKLGDMSLKKTQGERGDEALTDHSEEEETLLLRSDGELSISRRGSGPPDLPMSPTRSAESKDDEENYTLWQMLQSPSALLMLWTTTILVGGGTVETNEMGEMVEALGFPEEVTPASLAMFSVAQSAARVATGAISEAALNWNTRRCCIDNGVPRPLFLLLASCVAVVAHFMLGIATRKFFFVLGSALSGAAFGMVWPLMVLIVGEVFGTAHAAANYMFFDGFTSAIGTLLLTKLLAQDVYEHHIDPSSEDRTTCIGSGCFRATHMIVSLLSITCVFSSAFMLYVSRHVYNKSSPHTS